MSPRRRLPDSDSLQASGQPGRGIAQILWRALSKPSGLTARLFALVQHVLFLEKCRLCGSDMGDLSFCLEIARAICPRCWSDIKMGEPLRCTMALPLHGAAAFEHPALWDRQASLTIFSATTYRSGVKNLIWRFKYDGDVLLSRDLAELMADCLELLLQQLAPENPLLVPIPLHPKRCKKRGFNQADLLCRDLAKKYSLVLDRRILRRVKDTPALHKLNPDERREALSQAFHASAARLAGKSIVLVDDICTTGSTMVEAATALILAGAKEVVGLTVARPPLKDAPAPSTFSEMNSP